MNNYGYQNEFDFVNLFNNKYLYELDNNSQLFLKDLFGENIDNGDKIKSWKNKINQKTDIFVKYGNYVKRISLKCGKSNSVHSESLQSFRLYLEKLNIPYKVIDKYVSYHYGYMRNEDGTFDTSSPLSSEEYKVYYQDEIDVFNSYINKTRIIVDMIDRFIVRGRNSEYDIDALVSGVTQNYVWILKHDLYDLILSNRRIDYTSPHAACLTIGPKQRSINNLSSNNIKDKYVVTIRWSNIRECIEVYKKHL